MLRRLAPASVAAALLITGLTACSAQNSAGENCDALLQPGVMSDAVTVLGAFGDAPEVSIPEGVMITTSQRTTVSESGDASAARADDGTLVGVSMAIFDAESGDPLYAGGSFQNASPEYLLITEDQTNLLNEAVRCAAPGDRIVLGFAPADAAPLAAQLGGSEGDALVGVFDVASVVELSAQGSTRGLPAGYPAVVTNDEGRPGIVLPPSEAPAGTTSAARIVGDGDIVTAEDGIIAQVLEVSWNGTEALNSWTSSPMGLGAESQIEASGYTFRPELTGQPVGSQIVIIENDGVSEPRVLVVDILAVA